MKVVAVFSTKGGVGKTTTAVNLAHEAAKTSKVLVWDLDPQGAATYLYDVKAKVKGGAEALISKKKALVKSIKRTDDPNIDVLPADESYREFELDLDAAKKSSQRIAMALGQLKDDYDIAILDCPPGASLIAENALRASDVVVLPLIPSPLALRSLEQVEALVAETKKPPAVIGFLSQVDRRKGMHKRVMDELPSSHRMVSDVVVPYTVTVERMGEELAAVGEYAPTSEPAQAYAELFARAMKAAKK